MAKSQQLQVLEAAGRDIIRCMKECPLLKNVKIAFVGHVAVKRYLGDSDAWTEFQHLSGPRIQETLDVWITIPRASEVVLQRISEIETAPFLPVSDFLVYLHPSGLEMKVDFHANTKWPLTPSAAKIVREIDLSEELPWATPTDLLVMELATCRRLIDVLEDSEPDDAIDEEDLTVFHAYAATYLMETIQRQGPQILTSNERDLLLRDLSKFVEYSPKDLDWWHRMLAIPLKAA